MKYIECHLSHNGLCISVPLSSILSIAQNPDKTAFIETSFDINGESLGFFTSETYEEIMSKLSQAV